MLGLALSETAKQEVSPLMGAQLLGMFLLAIIARWSKFLSFFKAAYCRWPSCHLLDGDFVLEITWEIQSQEKWAVLLFFFSKGSCSVFLLGRKQSFAKTPLIPKNIALQGVPWSSITFYWRWPSGQSFCSKEERKICRKRFTKMTCNYLGVDQTFPKRFRQKVQYTSNS